MRVDPWDVVSIALGVRSLRRIAWWWTSGAVCARDTPLNGV